MTEFTLGTLSVGVPFGVHAVHLRDDLCEQGYAKVQTDWHIAQRRITITFTTKRESAFKVNTFSSLTLPT